MSTKQTTADVMLIGAGIMSATLGTMIKELDPDWKVQIIEKLPEAGAESSNEWNNAGTGHAALCELNYTSEKPDGTVDITKAININEQFQVSTQFWSYLVNQGILDHPASFIRPIPHLSFVQGAENVQFLYRRFQALSQNPLFTGMAFADDRDTLLQWMPVMMEERDRNEPVAATKIDSGTDVNFGALTRKLIDHLDTQDIQTQYNSEVENITRTTEGLWELSVRNHESGSVETHTAHFVFIGGGGGSLHLLQKTGIPESRGVGGFPVSGLFMMTKDKELIEKHHGKVYGKAKAGAPPMSVPHLDTRYIGGEKALLFGPFAGFSPKFLKTGSIMDLPSSIRPDNLITMVASGAKNVPLTKYLIEQVLQSKEQRMEELRDFIPGAVSDDWELVTAGQRVQVIKDTDHGGRGTLQFGTEVVTSEDGSIAALLGASPGASTAVSVMLDVMERCFPERMEEWTPKIRSMVPSYGRRLMDDPELLHEVHQTSADVLGLTAPDFRELLAAGQDQSS
ncbi:malate dehydrogenase (quinone) [Alkalicoccus chagannorensis]|uniref:malate dehydrogenase (quinone) n=1 Tax=Alkalicoccus chagannorensis TaxID=427072 RepID=UPI000411750D|nr:malate dehydrogenase (quinone) [Alkalicoccus chagannorensis]